MKRPLVLALLTGLAVAPYAGLILTKQQITLGKELYFDTNLSFPAGQACGSCHAPEAGWVSPDKSVHLHGGVHPGAVSKLFGNRKPPAVAYAAFSPEFHYDPETDSYFGGQFWDGRANTLTDQAKGPFLNPVEQNNPSKQSVVYKAATSRYGYLFNEVYGPNGIDYKRNVEQSYHRIAESIAAFEASPQVNPFDSKFDYFLKGRAQFTQEEIDGLNLFQEFCTACHRMDVGPEPNKPVFTNYGYENIGTPKNPDNPFYKMPARINPQGANWIDLGLYNTTGRPQDKGKFKTPTVRNVDKRPYPGFVKSYGHNGFFKSLEEIVSFYNTRDVAAWPASEVPETASTMLLSGRPLGNLELTNYEEAALVAFMKTLTDGYIPQ